MVETILIKALGFFDLIWPGFLVVFFWLALGVVGWLIFVFALGFYIHDMIHGISYGEGMILLGPIAIVWAVYEVISTLKEERRRRH